MKKIILTKGLPGSGKSTWAKSLQESQPHNYKRINKDDLRAMLDDSRYSSANEAAIIEARNLLLNLFLNKGYNVIIDDTNLNPIHEKDINEIAKDFNAQIEIKDFTHISPATCIERDLKRSNSVGSDIILQMYNKYLKPTIKPIEYNPELNDCVIFDIDGTLAHMNGRSPYEWSKVEADYVDDVVREHVYQWSLKGVKIIIMSGRDSVCRELTENWLKENNINYDILLMRAEGDHRKDSLVKEELYRNNVEGKYNVKVVYDDRKQVVDMWRDLGLKVFQVAEGNF